MSGKQGGEKPEDTVSNADTGYETSSVVSASSSSQITKVRHIIFGRVLRLNYPMNIFMNFINIANSIINNWYLDNIKLKLLMWTSSLT